MCLAEAKDRKVAKTDMTVFKLIIMDHFNELRTPCMYAPIKIGEMYKSALDKVTKNRWVDKGLHSFRYQTDAESYCSSIVDSNAQKAFVVRCTIPARSHYHEGLYWIYSNAKPPAYVSTRLRYDEIVKEIHVCV